MEEYETEECPTCSGNGFSGCGTGYDAVCDDCAGSGETLKQRGGEDTNEKTY